MRVHWHRRDLRISDNVGLSDPSSRPIGLFIFDPAILTFASANRVVFLQAAIYSLRSAYKNRGSELVIRHGDPGSIFTKLLADCNISEVSWNHSYSGLGKTRDAKLRSKLEDFGIRIQTFHDALCHPPGSITSNKGTPYVIFRYFWDKWNAKEPDGAHSIPTLFNWNAVDGEISAGSVPSRESLEIPEPTVPIPAASAKAAERLLTQFLDEPIYTYLDIRDYPARDATSRLGVHLKFGTIGIRTIIERVNSLMESASEEQVKSITEFQRQLAWREFYFHILTYNPQIVTENFQSFQTDLSWENNENFLSSWKNGNTGFPIVDAGMRQLLAEGYMHNRLRMIVASFLTKDLLINWRYGYAHFREHLLDHETANESGGWQWAASTGMDAQPYFRIFNPMRQGEQYDSKAAYIKSYIPELSEVPANKIHQWDSLSTTHRSKCAPEYPDPIVDHATRREMALDMFESARQSD